MDWISHKGQDPSIEIDNSNSLSKQEGRMYQSHNMEPSTQQRLYHNTKPQPLKKSEEEGNTFINIIINNNNNNNFVMRTNQTKGGFDLSPNVTSAQKDKFLLDFTHKYNKKIYQHRKETKKDLTYPDVPPNSFNFDEFDVMGFLDSIKTLGNMYRGETSAPRARNLSIKMLDQNFNEDTHNFDPADRATNPNHKEPEFITGGGARMVEYGSGPRARRMMDSQSGVPNANRVRGKTGALRFATAEDMKENAALQIRKIKFFWRGTQTNLPYIFKRQMKEVNVETMEAEYFEKFEYSKKKIKTNNHDESN